ncbi:MAG: Mini-ribonuclease 3 [Eubacteriales bacterium]
MEKSVDFIDSIRSQFDCRENDIKTYSPLVLAYIGDGVYELVIRTILIENGNCAPNTLHKIATKYVNAKTQAKLITRLQEELTDEEMIIYRRGRNAKSHTSAKNASITDYRKATGLEALIGYLYLTNQQDRMLTLIQLGLEVMEEEVGVINHHRKKE